MEKSKQFQEILSLGKTLESLFEDHSRSDLTTAWMAHYLAELMQQSVQEKNAIKKRAIQKECTELILSLWDKRNHFPRDISPLSGLSHAVSIIKALQDDKSEDLYWRRLKYFESDKSWGGYLYSLRTSVEKAMRITLSAAVTKQVMEREKKWLKHKSFLTDKEKLIIEFLDTQLENDHEIVRIIYANEKKPSKKKQKPDKMALVFSKLHELINKQKDALIKLESEIIKPSRQAKTKRAVSK